MLLLILVSVSSLTCIEKLKESFTKDLYPRIDSFNSEGKGLDYLSPIDQCKVSKHSIYMLIQWQSEEFPLVSYGFCMPEECSSANTTSVINSGTFPYLHEIEIGNFSVKSIDLQKNPEYTVFSFIFLISFLVLMILTCTSTYLTLIKGKNMAVSEFESKWIKLLSHFDLVKNTKKFFDFQDSFHNLGFFDGIRMICSISILMIHTYFFTIFLPLSNRREFNKTINSFFFTVLGYFNYSVDVFFFIAGFLMCILTLAEINSKKEKFSWTKCVIRRLIRYLPCYFFIIGVDRVFPQGSPESIGTVNFYLIGQKSSQIWWKNLFFLQNQFSDKTPPHLPWTWTIAADFQFYLTSLFFVFIYSRNKSAGLIGACIIVAVSLTYTAFVSYSLNMFVDIFELSTNPGYLEWIYFPFWPRISPFLIGVVVGFVYQMNLDKENIISEQSLAYRIAREVRFKVHDAGFCFKTYRFILILNIVICVLPSIFKGFERNYLFLVLSTFWLSVGRTIVTLSFACFSIPLMFGHYKKINIILSSKICKFYSKISYCFYLIHPLVIGAVNISVNSHLEFTLWTWAIETLYIIIYSSIVAVIISILVENPFLGIERQYFSR